MELRHLRYFVAVAEELNFRRAAERLHVSPPALSVQVRMLEALLDARLLDRDTTMVRLTVAGEVLLREARRLLRHVRDAEDFTREAARGLRGVLRIGNPGQFGYSFMSRVLESHLKRFPKVDVSLVELDVELEQPDAVQNGTVQIGFVYGSLLRFQRGVESVLVIDAPLRVVMGREHPLASSRQVSLREMAAYPLLSVMRYDSHINTMLAMFQQRRLEPKSVKKVDGYTAYMAMLAAGQGVSVLPEMRILSQTEGVVTRPLLDNVPDFRVQIHAIWKTSETSPQVRNFIEELRLIGVQPD